MAVRMELARRRWSASQLARSVGLSQTALSRRLTGALPFRVDELTAIAGVLGIPTRSLIPDDDDAASSTEKAAS